jgi:hypothetical protein
MLARDMRFKVSSDEGYENLIHLSIYCIGTDGKEQYRDFYLNDVTTVQRPTEATPFVTITKGQAQTLVDELASCGIRTSEHTDNTGVIAARDAHIKDLQVIINHLLHKIPDQGVIGQPLLINKRQRHCAHCGTTLINGGHYRGLRELCDKCCENDSGPLVTI